jgi:hypothetical protein
MHPIEHDRFAKQTLKYYPIGRRRLGRQLKRLMDDMGAQVETGHL